jgi:folylpolyglutamate synthase/dihydropteroate synthase
VAEALRVAAGMAGAEGLVVVCGSLYLVGDVKRLLTGATAR